MVGTARSGLQSEKSRLVELVDGMANRLFVAGQRLRNAGNRFPTSGSQQNLAPPKDESIRGTQPGAERLLFLFGKVADKNVWFHRGEYATSGSPLLRMH